MFGLFSLYSFLPEETRGRRIGRLLANASMTNESEPTTVRSSAVEDLVTSYLHSALHQRSS